MKFVIDRSKWARGGPNLSASELLDNKGNMCCLGFYSKALGYYDGDIKGKMFPKQVIQTDLYPSWVFDVLGEHSKDVRQLISLNDCPISTEEYREKRIQEIFAMNGVEVEFIGPKRKVKAA